MYRFWGILAYLARCTIGRALPLAALLLLSTLWSAVALGREPSDVDFVQYVSNMTPYVGEQILYKTEVAANENFLGGNLEDIEPTGFYREKLGDKEKEIRESGSISVRSFSEVLIPTKPGKLEIPPRLLTVRLRTPGDGVRRPRFANDPFGGIFEEDPFSPMFGRQKTVTKQLVAPALSLDVKPLPPPPFDYRSYIPVGSLTMKVATAPQEIIEGESATLTIFFRGTANLRPLEQPEIAAGESSEFKLYPDKPVMQNGFRDGMIQYSKTFKIALVPQHAGKLKLPTFKVLAFNPSTEKYDILEPVPGILNVLPAKGKKEDMQLALPEGKQAPDMRIDNKKDVQLLAEDLLPQHTGPEVLSRKRSFSSNTTILLLGLLPLLSLAFRILAGRRAAFQSDPAQLLQKNAYRSALTKLESLERDAAAGNAVGIEQAKDVLYSYLGERLKLRLESLTAKEALELLTPQLRNAESCAKLLAFLEGLEKVLYAGATMKAGSCEKLLAQEKGLIAKLEQDLPNV